MAESFVKLKLRKKIKKKTKKKQQPKTKKIKPNLHEGGVLFFVICFVEKKQIILL